MKQDNNVQIATWNVNSVRQRTEHLVRYLREVEPDVLCLQELKCLTEAFPYLEVEACGYNCAVHGQKGFNGVAILPKRPIEVTHGLPGDESDEHARYIEAVVPTGTGEAWIRKYCADSLPIHAAKTALFTAFNRRAGDLREELSHLGQIWADCMLRLSPSAISKLQRIAQTQDRMLARVYQRQMETA